MNFYLEKKSSSYDRKQGYSLHEQALEPCLKCIMLIYKRNPENYVSVNFIEKIMKENYQINDYKTLKGILRIVCRNNEKLSDAIISSCLKNIYISAYEDCIGYLMVIFGYKTYRRSLS